MAPTNPLRRRHFGPIDQSPITTETKQEETKLSKNPEFSVKDLRAIIPKELWKHSYTKSFYWLIHDITIILTLIYLAATYLNEDYVPFQSVRAVLWCLWWYVEGAFFFGAWILAHECGHQAFTPNKQLNNVVGFILHSMLLVPYFSWQYTHAQHHARTNNLEEDTNHLPRMKYDSVKDFGFEVISTEEFESGSKKDLTPLDRMLKILAVSGLGWPLYLLFDVSGPPAHDELSWVNHFNPFCEYFPRSMANWVMISDIGLVAWIWFLFRCYKTFGAMNILFYYFIPYLINNHWLVTITLLQHIEFEMDKYAPSEWTWLRGAFGTIDRDYGLFLNYAHHHIADSHVIHHLFSKMPFYNAVKATKLLKESPVFGQYYNESKESWYGALWNIVGTGRWMKDSDHVLTFKK